MTKTILAIDDSPSVRMMVQMTLSGAGYSAVLAVDGEDGLEEAPIAEPADRAFHRFRPGEPSPGSA